MTVEIEDSDEEEEEDMNMGAFERPINEAALQGDVSQFDLGSPSVDGLSPPEMDDPLPLEDDDLLSPRQDHSPPRDDDGEHEENSAGLSPPENPNPPSIEAAGVCFGGMVEAGSPVLSRPAASSQHLTRLTRLRDQPPRWEKECYLHFILLKIFSFRVFNSYKQGGGSESGRIRNLFAGSGKFSPDPPLAM